LFNGNLHLTKVQKRFNNWVKVFNQISGKTILLKNIQPVGAISLQTGWLSGFFEADGGFSASLIYNERYALNHRLTLKSFLDQKGELEVLERIASLIKVKNVRIRNKIKKYYQVECHSKVHLLILTKYFEIYPCRGRKQEAQQEWAILSLMYMNSTHLKAELEVLRQKVNKIQELNQLFKLYKSVLKLEQFQLENTIFL
jgi:LAGLIDADG endonuclease